MRFKVSVSLAVAALTFVACATASQSLSTPKAMKACLVKGGAKIDTGPRVNLFDYPEILHEIDWTIGSGKNSVTYEIDIRFTRDANHAAKLEKRLTILGLSYGFTRSELSHSTGRRGNVVWTTDVGHPASAKQLALLDHCLGV